MIREKLRRVAVREVLNALDPGGRVTFQLVPRECLAGRWQGGRYLEVRRAGSSRKFKVGALGLKNLTQMTEFVNAAFDNYRAPRV